MILMVLKYNHWKKLPRQKMQQINKQCRRSENIPSFSESIFGKWHIDDDANAYDDYHHDHDDTG